MDISVRIAMHSLLRSLIAEEGLTVVAINHDLHAAYASATGSPLCRWGPGLPGRTRSGHEFDLFPIRIRRRGGRLRGQGFIIRIDRRSIHGKRAYL